MLILIFGTSKSKALKELGLSVPGTSFFPDAEWQEISSDPAVIAALDEGRIEVIADEDGKPVDDISMLAIQEATQVIKFTNSSALLNKFMNNDNRKIIKEAVNERLQNLRIHADDILRDRESDSARAINLNYMLLGAKGLGP